MNVCRDNIGRYASKSNRGSFDDITVRFEQEFAKNKATLKNKIKEHKNIAKRIRAEKFELHTLLVNILTRKTLSLSGKCFKNLCLLFFGGLFIFLVVISIREYEHGAVHEKNYKNIKNGVNRFIETNVTKHLNFDEISNNITNNALSKFISSHLNNSQDKLSVSRTADYIPRKVNDLLSTLNAEHYSKDEFDELVQDVQAQYFTQENRIKFALKQGVQNGNMTILNNSLENHSLNPNLVMIGAIESDFDNTKVSHSGSACMMQMSRTGAMEVGVSNREALRENTKACSDAGSRLLVKFAQQFNNDLTLSVASYNIGNTYIKNIRRKNKIINYIDIKRALERERDIDLAQTSYIKHSQIKKRFAEQVSYLPLFLASVIIANEQGLLT